MVSKVVQSGGDDVSAIVVDPGFDTLRIGNCQEDYPREYIPSALCRGTLQNEYLPWVPLRRVSPPSFVEMRQLLQYNRDENIEVEPFVFERLIRLGIEGSSREVSSVLENDELFSTKVGGLGLDVRQHPMLVSEPTAECKQFRDSTLEILFEQLDVPAAYLAKRASLSAFSVGRQSALVVDIGAGGCIASPVHEGISLQSTIKTSLVGGNALDVQLCHILYESGHDFFRPGVSAAHDYHRQWVAREIRESSCSLTASDAQQSYRLPDGDTLQLDEKARDVPRFLFSPESATVSEFNNFKGLYGMVTDSVFDTDVDIRRELLSSIVVVGGVSLTPGLVDELNKQLAHGTIGRASKFKLVHPSSYSEARYSTWLGGSILASLGRFQQLWISRGEYREHGLDESGAHSIESMEETSETEEWHSPAEEDAVVSDNVASSDEEVNVEELVSSIMKGVSKAFSTVTAKKDRGVGRDSDFRLYLQTIKTEPSDAQPVTKRTSSVSIRAIPDEASEIEERRYKKIANNGGRCHNVQIG
ncbi:Actin-related protein 4 [Babesia sp. Xinjiang]|uniref:Actin-related protein 4 n=1 Tax=Babesia sp. Xinjiang TaxID=462227 RepID=UPI000A23A4F2|nr:Actin-related protein 4 [Babesia sp. Xinjiang]ORM40462.1 Actin-related protein 4 [Babesia sp. Xinjiang]